MIIACITMKTHTTNYENAFIEVAEDCPAQSGEVPPQKGDAKTVANLQFDLLHKHPYKYTSDDVIFQVYADRNDLTKKEYKEAREAFFFERAALSPHLSADQTLRLGSAS